MLVLDTLLTSFGTVIKICGLLLFGGVEGFTANYDVEYDGFKYNLSGETCESELAKLEQRIQGGFQHDFEP